MGAGKSTVGKRLARETGLPFIDTDLLIEKRENASIRDIFERKGEDYFRELEKKIIWEVSRKGGEYIVATGGGALLDPDNERSLRERGFLICLKASPKEILKRIQGGLSRPLLKKGNDFETIKNLLMKRKKIYQSAEMIIQTDRKTPEKIVALIQKKLDLKLKVKQVSIPVSLNNGRSYQVLVGHGNLDQIGEHLAKRYRNKIAVVTNPLVWKLHGSVLKNSLVGAGLKPLVIVIPDGERYKNLRWVNFAIRALLKGRFERKDPILAFGGGVIGDLAGMVSGIYLRGTPFIQVPTTLIAQVDSSIGGKTGVNDPSGKNLIGVFHQPDFVWIDTSLLQTLKQRDYVSGLGEVIKYGMIADPNFFEFLENSRDPILNRHPRTVLHMIKRSCQIKANVVSQDEKEAGLRKILNYGHTLGHAIESVTQYRKYRHGEAIAIGMHFAARLGARMKQCPESVVERQRILIESLRLPSKFSNRKLRQIMNSMALDKKVEAGRIFFILPSKIGSVVIKPIDQNVIREAIKDFMMDS